MRFCPSASTHQVQPLTCGNRFALFFWIQRMIRGDGIRMLLPELDQAIQNLASERGIEDKTCVRLTDIYHNLIRRLAVV